MLNTIGVVYGPLYGLDDRHTPFRRFEVNFPSNRATLLSTRQIVIIIAVTVFKRWVLQVIRVEHMSRIGDDDGHAFIRP